MYDKLLTLLSFDRSADEIRSSINIRHFVCESRAKVLLSGPGILLTTVSSHSLGRSRRSFGNQRSPQSSRSSQSSQNIFETTGTIETIRTIIWKPGLNSIVIVKLSPAGRRVPFLHSFDKIGRVCVATSTKHTMD